LSTVTQSRPVVEPWLTDPEAAWWAKLGRANTHRETLANLVDEFEESEPYTLTPEPGDKPDEVAYRLRILREAPAEISTVVGDVLHNLRSALDSVAYGLAVHSKGELTEREEQVTGFPWRPNSAEYDRFFGIGVDPKKNPDDGRLVRVRIYGQEARDAMRVVQPFWLAEIANLPETERRQHSDDDFKWSSIYRLQQLSNIDKHRRLPAVGVGWPEMIWWLSDEGDDTRFRSGHMPPTDNTILCYLVGANATNIALNTDFALVLEDDPRHQPGTDEQYQPQDCQKLLEGFALDVETTVRLVLGRYNAELNR
jgi:hypothetical protein